MTSTQTPQTPKWGVAYVIFFLLTSLTSDGAIFPSGSTSLTSASVSSSATANQRFTRSSENLDPMEREMEDMDVDECSKDFVEMFFDVLEGPVGKEAEALLATVLKLLSENDRVNLLSSADPDLPSEGVLSQHPQQLLTSKRHFQLQGSNPDSLKRRLPKFNPTGWRRKRATYSARYSLQQFLNRLFTKLRASRPREAVSPELPERDVMPKFGEWRNKKRESLRKVLQRLPKELKPKRRPLEFNPTGW